jgi:hypothetical protein
MLESHAFSVPGSFFLMGQMHGAADLVTGAAFAPPVSFDYGGGEFSVWTRSEAAPGVIADRFSEPLPTAGQWTNLVACIVLGTSGTLEVWRNGTKVVDFAGILGQPSEPGKGAYWQFGIYATDGLPTAAAARYKNVEWGTADLSDRILNPLV